MNNTCCGDVLAINGRVCYRCLRDSAIVTLDDGVPNVCPNCERPCTPANYDKSLFDAVKQAAVVFQKAKDNETKLLLTLQNMTDELGSVRSKLGFTQEMLEAEKAKSAPCGHKKKIKKLKHKLAEMEQDLANVTDHRDRLRVQLEDSLDSGKKSAYAVEKMRQDNASLRGQLAEEHRTLESLRRQYDSLKADHEGIAYAYRTSESMLSQEHAKAMRARQWAGVWKRAAKFWRKVAEADYWIIRHDAGDKQQDSEAAPLPVLSLTDAYQYQLPGNTYSLRVDSADQESIRVCCTLEHDPEYFTVKNGEIAICPVCGRQVQSVVKRGVRELRHVYRTTFDIKYYGGAGAQIVCRCISPYKKTAVVTLANNERAERCPECRTEYRMIDGLIYRNDAPEARP